MLSHREFQSLLDRNKDNVQQLNITNATLGSELIGARELLIRIADVHATFGGCVLVESEKGQASLWMALDSILKDVK